MIRRWSVLTALLTLVALVLGALPARAANDWKITRYDTAVTVDTSGTAQVRVDFDFDFGNDPGHGPQLALVQRQVDADPNRWRNLDITLGQVTSPSGAPATVHTESNGDVLAIRIGDEGRKVRGVQRYVVNYTIRGLIAPDHASSGLDEFNFNPVGTAWEVPIAGVTASLTGPIPTTQVACFSGRSYSTPCTATAEGNTITYAAPDLAPGEGMQIVAGYPAGTFVGAEPTYSRRFTPANTFTANPATLGTTGVVTLAGLVFVVGSWLRRRRNEVYVGLTPGLTPPPGSAAPTKLIDGSLPVAVAFTPPKGVTPGEVGVLQDGRADSTDVTATILDLAARGHMQIIQEGDGDWRFAQRHSNNADLNSAEQFVMATLFQRGNSVTTDELKQPSYAELLTQGRHELDLVVTRRGWFRGNLTAMRVRQGLIGLVLLLGGAALTYVLAVTIGWGLPALALALVGLLALVFLFGGRGRSADGSAVLVQAEGFKQYLTTAEADQIRFEEGIDVFSRYLPYAVVFGVADRWAKLFEQLAAQGRYTPTDWYVGYGTFNTWQFSSAMHSLNASLSSSLMSSVAASASTSGSSGGSGFSGGGGFGGGGGGGW